MAAYLVLTQGCEGSSPSAPTNIAPGRSSGYNSCMETLEVKVLQRYFRKTQSRPEGGVEHHGDCDFFSLRVCTCGLHHDLKPAPPELVDRLFPHLYGELADSEKSRETLMRSHKRTRRATG